MYSAPAIKQDKWVVERLGRKYRGTFVDIGAHDGLHHSNTALLEKVYGWKGILVEPQPQLYAECLHNRSGKNLFFMKAIGPSKAHAQFYEGGAYGGIRCLMPNDWIEEHVRRKTPLINVPVVTLEHILDLWTAPPMIDYLSLDVEGAELAILESYFLREPKTHFRVMTIEFRFDGLLLKRMEQLLASDYVLEEVRAYDAFFVHKSVHKYSSLRVAA